MIVSSLFFVAAGEASTLFSGYIAGECFSIVAM